MNFVMFARVGRSAKLSVIFQNGFLHLSEVRQVAEASFNCNIVRNIRHLKKWIFRILGHFSLFAKLSIFTLGLLNYAASSQSRGSVCYKSDIVN